MTSSINFSLNVDRVKQVLDLGFSVLGMVLDLQGVDDETCKLIMRGGPT